MQKNQPEVTRRRCGLVTGQIWFANWLICTTGLATQREKTVRQVSSLHFRKSGFMNGFQALAAGAKRVQQPSFLERAKADWSERHRNHS
jgi:hypothetical protein